MTDRVQQQQYGGDQSGGGDLSPFQFVRPQHPDRKKTMHPLSGKNVPAVANAVARTTSPNTDQWSIATPSETISFTVSNVTEDVRQDDPHSPQSRNTQGVAARGGGGGDCCGTRTPASAAVGSRQDHPRAASSNHANATTASNDEIGFEVVAAKDQEIPNDGSQDDQDTATQTTMMGENHEDHDNTIDASSSHASSSVVFNFSGIATSESQDLILGEMTGAEGGVRTRESPTFSSDDTEYVLLLAEVESLIMAIPITKLSTPKAANNNNNNKDGNDKGGGDALGPNQHHSEKDDESPIHPHPRTLTSIYSRHTGELSRNTYSKIIQHLSAMKLDTPQKEKEKVARDLFRLGIRVAQQSPRRRIVQSRDDNIDDNDDDEADEADVTQATVDLKLPIQSKQEQPNQGGTAVMSEVKESTSFSSTANEVEQKWESFRSTNVNKLTIDPFTSSYDGDRHAALQQRATEDSEDRRSGVSGTSITSDMWEADLIQDCVETGLPSPRKVKTSNEAGFLSPRDTEHEKSGDEAATKYHSNGGGVDNQTLLPVLEEHATVTAPPLVLQRHGQPDDTDDEQPVKQRGRPDEDLDSEQPASRKRYPSVSSSSQPKAKHAEIGAKLSTLAHDGSAEEEERENRGPMKTNRVVNLMREEMPIIHEPNHRYEEQSLTPSRTYTANKNPKDGNSPFIRRVITSTGSCPLPQKLTHSDLVKSQSQPVLQARSRRIKESFEDDSRLPRIEVSLLPSGDSSSRNKSISNDSHCPSSSSGEKTAQTNQDWEGQKTNAATKQLKSRDERPTEILQVSSTLTGATNVGELKTSKTNESTNSRNPILNLSNRPWLRDDCSQPADLSVGYSSAKSFESRLSGQEKCTPTWRLSPSESLSDFSLEVLNEKTGVVTIFHVHKHVLAVGPRRSEFLDELFHSKSTESYRVALDDLASSLIPHVLDFMYCHDYSIAVTTENAASLRQLGRMFRIIPLVVKVAGFIMEDMKVSNLDTYVADSCFYQDESLMKVIVAKSAESIRTIGVRHALWAVMPPGLFLRVISSPTIDRDTLSDYLSILLKEYLAMHEFEVDTDMFIALTGEEIVPTIDREAALPLIELCEKYDSSSGRCELLQRRCAYTMACFWKTTSPEDRHRLFALLRNLPSTFTVDFLEIVETGNALTMLKQRKHVKGKNGSREDTPKAESISIGTLFDRLAGQDGYSILEGGTEEDLLSWRLDALRSYSDWSIRVKHLTHPSGDVYHVHKHVLSIGSHRSDFFAKQFLTSRNTDTTASRLSSTSKQGWTTVELDHKAAAVFPQMLDFIYSPSHHLVVSRSTAIALRFLARVFEVPALSKRVLEFIKKDLSLSNLLIYIHGADSFEDEKVIGMAARLCARDIRQVDVDSKLLKDLKPDFFAKVVSSSDVDPSAGCHVTLLITQFFSLHDLDEIFLGELLRHTGKIDKIDYVSAMKLLKILSGLKSRDIAIFDEMQRKCSNVLTENWNEIRGVSEYREQLYNDIFPHLNSKLLTDIFDVIDHQYQVDQLESMNSQSRLVKRYQKQMSEASARHEEEVSALEKELEDRTIEMLSIQQSLAYKLEKVNETLSRRTCRSTAAYGIQLPKVSFPLSPTKGPTYSSMPISLSPQRKSSLLSTKGKTPASSQQTKDVMASSGASSTSSESSSGDTSKKKGGTKLSSKLAEQTELAKKNRATKVDWTKKMPEPPSDDEDNNNGDDDTERLLLAQNKNNGQKTEAGLCCD